MVPVRQHARGTIDEAMLDELVAPLIAARTAKASELDTLLAQKELQDAADDAEERIRECFGLYAQELANVDFEAKEALLSIRPVRAIGTRERVLVLAEIGPSVFTTEHTSA